VAPVISVSYATLGDLRWFLKGVKGGLNKGVKR
jgi:hypothetical protein